MPFTPQQEADLIALLNRGTRTMSNLPEQAVFDGTLYVRVLDESELDVANRDKKMRITRI